MIHLTINKLDHLYHITPDRSLLYCNKTLVNIKRQDELFETDDLNGFVCLNLQDGPYLQISPTDQYIKHFDGPQALVIHSINTWDCINNQWNLPIDQDTHYHLTLTTTDGFKSVIVDREARVYEYNIIAKWDEGCPALELELFDSSLSNQLYLADALKKYLKSCMEGQLF